jgi:hypothetical protein
MTTWDWPHGHLAHAFCEQLTSGTDAADRVTSIVPRQRSYPLLVVQSAGVGPLGTVTIQADEPRLQIDAWAETKVEAEHVAGQVFRLIDKRFGGLQDTDLVVQDDSVPGDFYRVPVERVTRNGYTVAFDEIAQVWRATAFYHVKVNLE